ncbi:hypothetical protein F4604DRAFT_1098321 [Suillus subluteus]|nr:hypothetical protein F4604DRAFT_1098321 [Suillus subluteus]
MSCYGYFQPSMLDTTFISLSARQALNIGKQSRAAALGLLIYEHIITIEDEIDLVWLKRKSWVTCLYHFNRWLPALWLTFDAIFWTPALILEPIICILVLKKVFLDRHQRGELATSLARDSLLYFLVIFMELVGSTIVWARYPSYIDLFMPWSIALPSMLCNRLLLNMRGRFARESEPVHSSLLIELATLRTSADSRVPDEE